MALIAREDTYVVDSDGIRRKLAKGAPIPAHLAARMDIETDQVETRSLSRPVVDEESKLSQAELTKRAKGESGARQSAAKKD